MLLGRLDASETEVAVADCSPLRGGHLPCADAEDGKCLT